jgi:hypothetical protein
LSVESPRRELHRLESGDPRPDFSCGDEDIDEFFHQDSNAWCDELLCVTYVFTEDDRAVSFFSIANDSIKKDEIPRSGFERLTSLVPFSKRYSSMPAAKIGRLGVREDLQRSGEGARVLNWLKVSFTRQNKTGCRFLVVDAYNTPRVKNFYLKNGFQFLTTKDESDKTRIMYYDLMKFARPAGA